MLDFTEINECSEWEQLDEEKDLVKLAIQYLETSNVMVEEVYMTEIQLRRIVDRTAKEQQAHPSDGDETMTKDGKTISKFSKEAMNIGENSRFQIDLTPPIQYPNRQQAFGPTNLDQTFTPHDLREMPTN